MPDDCSLFVAFRVLWSYRRREEEVEENREIAW